MITAPADLRRPGAHARVCAGLAFASVAAHLWMAWTHRAMPAEAALMVLMALACLPCAFAVWRGVHGRGTQLLLAMALVMAVAHAALLLLPTAGVHVHSGAGAGTESMTMPGSPVPAMAAPMAGVAGMAGMPAGSQAGMLGVIILEFAVAAAAAALLRRRRVRAAASSPVGV